MQLILLMEKEFLVSCVKVVFRNKQKTKTKNGTKAKASSVIGNKTFSCWVIICFVRMCVCA